MSIIFTLASQIAPYVVFVIIIGTSLWAGNYFLYRGYYSDRVADSKDAGECPDILIASEVLALINDLDPSIKIRISNDPDLAPQAASFRSKPAYVILPKWFLERDTTEAISFNTNEVVAIVAHELGHIVPKSHTEWLMSILFNGLVASLLSWVAAVFMWRNWSGSLYALLAFAFAIMWINHTSQADEYRADTFAVTVARIPIADLAHALIKLESRYSRRRSENLTRLSFLKDSLGALLIVSHPPIEQRILRIRTLYGD